PRCVLHSFPTRRSSDLWVESVGMYTAAIAAIGVAAAEFLVRLTGWDSGSIPWLGAGLVALFTAVNLIGVASGRWVQNLVTAAKRSEEHTSELQSRFDLV